MNGYFLLIKEDCQHKPLKKKLDTEEIGLSKKVLDQSSSSLCIDIIDELVLAENFYRQNSVKRASVQLSKFDLFGSAYPSKHPRQMSIDNSLGIRSFESRRSSYMSANGIFNTIDS